MIKAKSPSLSEEHFTSINCTKTSEKSSLNELSMNSSKVSSSSSHNNSKTMFNSNNDSGQNTSNFEEDEKDESYDKSSTLKAAIQLNTVLSNTGTKPINRFNSDKSIYYSSVSSNFNRSIFLKLKKNNLLTFFGLFCKI